MIIDLGLLILRNDMSNLIDFEPLD